VVISKIVYPSILLTNLVDLSISLFVIHSVRTDFGVHVIGVNLMENFYCI
jgi:hypothetical protein